MSKTTDKVKTHLKKYHVQYIVGGTVVLGAVSLALHYKRISGAVKIISDGIPKRFSLGGPDSPLKFSLLPEEAAAYNRAASGFLTSNATKIPGTNTFYPPKNLSKSDITVFNNIGRQVNDFIAKHGPITEEFFDINRAMLEEIL